MIHIFFCVATMISSIINGDFEHHPLTHPLTPKNTVMGQRIQGHFQNKVSNVAVKVGGEWGGVLFLWENNGENITMVSHIVMHTKCTKTLTN